MVDGGVTMETLHAAKRRKKVQHKGKVKRGCDRNKKQTKSGKKKTNKELHTSVFRSVPIL